jgi:hypothetical protein
MRISHVQRRTDEDQFPYYQLCRRREKAWLLWKQGFDRIASLHRRERQAARAEIVERVKRYRELDQMVRDEWHRAVARDALILEELRSQGVLVTEPAPSEPPSLAAASDAGARQEQPMTAGEGKPASPATDEGQADPAASPEMEGGDPQAESVEPIERTGRSTTVPDGERAPAAAMRQADFEIPDLPKSGLRYADPEFSMAGLPGGMLSELNLSGASFAGVRLTGVHYYRRCNLSGVDFRGAALPRAERPHQFVECDLTGASFASAELEYALFLRCNLSYSQWQGARLNRVKFAGCRILGTQWSGVDLSRTVMTPETLAQGNFSQALQPPRAPSAPSLEPPGSAQAQGAAPPPGGVSGAPAAPSVPGGPGPSASREES